VGGGVGGVTDAVQLAPTTSTIAQFKKTPPGKIKGEWIRGEFRSASSIDTAVVRSRKLRKKIKVRSLERGVYIRRGGDERRRLSERGDWIKKQRQDTPARKFYA